MTLLRPVALLVAASLLVAVTGCASQHKASSTPAGQITQLTFSTPEEAVAALDYLAASGDRAYGRSLFGPEVDEFSSGDPKVDAYERQAFARAIRKRHEMRRNDDGTIDIVIGDKGALFPVPLTQTEGRWMFDTPEGVERLTDLRVGFYELRTVEVLRAVALAQREYFATPRTADGVQAYAGRFISTEGHHDGLYWPTTATEPSSPLGPFVAEAAGAPRSATRGYYGYFYKLITTQGPGAPGGAKSYADASGRLTGGYAVLAYPAVYDETGVMTFVMGPDGVVYEKDLGLDATPNVGNSITTFDPAGWNVTRD